MINPGLTIVTVPHAPVYKKVKESPFPTRKLSLNTHMETPVRRTMNLLDQLLEEMNEDLKDLDIDFN
ncbi:hypothetical protein HK103_004360 [Boothiomyces macroporosus]|uniref:Uncharacterized protein n=1 Tax=Boothiomyces macroporosus TaxID=261099 RepID=A0AAD5UGQ9_9FUNG|nr:hypothetical protein HK103_004360 [Boothiomyces macroporosus]